jgi:D-3-phosphoglycerate dehydrogenase
MDIKKVAMIIDWKQAKDQDYKVTLKKMGVEYLKKQCNSDEEVIALARDADCIMTIANLRPVSPIVVEKLEKLKLIQTISAGIDGLPLEKATERGVCVANVPGYCAEEMSDHVMALMLAWSRKIIESDKMMRAGTGFIGENRSQELLRLASKMNRLKGMTLGIIGLGMAGKALVPKARGFGMRVLAYDPYVPIGAYQELGVGKVDLNQLLVESDYISIHCPLTSETRHLMGLRQFKMMKPHAFLINTSRGGIVDSKALYVALAEDHIGGAGLDVTDPDPIDPKDPLMKLEDVIFSGHTAFAGPTSEAELFHRPLEQIARVKRGEWPECFLNPEVKEKFVQKWGTPNGL